MSPTAPLHRSGARSHGLLEKERGAVRERDFKRRWRQWRIEKSPSGDRLERRCDAKRDATLMVAAFVQLTLCGHSQIVRECGAVPSHLRDVCSSFFHAMSVCGQLRPAAASLRALCEGVRGTGPAALDRINRCWSTRRRRPAYIVYEEITTKAHRRAPINSPNRRQPSGRCWTLMECGHLRYCTGRQPAFGFALAITS
jgi:hypothetical protein